MVAALEQLIPIRSHLGQLVAHGGVSWDMGAGHRTRNGWGSVAMILSVSPRSSSFSSRPNTALVTRNASRASDGGRSSATRVANSTGWSDGFPRARNGQYADASLSLADGYWWCSSAFPHKRDPCCGPTTRSPAWRVVGRNAPAVVEDPSHEKRELRPQVHGLFRRQAIAQDVQHRSQRPVGGPTITAATPPKLRSLRLRRSWAMPPRSGECSSPIPTCPKRIQAGVR